MAANKEEGVQVVYKDETIWAIQAVMSELFGCSGDNIGLHLKNIYAEGELLESATAEKISVVQLEGSRNVNREPTFYNLDFTIFLLPIHKKSRIYLVAINKTSNFES